MTRQVLFIQGGGHGAHDKWDNKLVNSLSNELGPGYTICYPVMPNEADPSYAAWKAALMKEFDVLKRDAMLVGHSLGGTILINVLTEWAPQRAIGGIFIIAAPFVGEGGWTSQDIEPRSDFAARLPPGIPIFLYHGREDEIAPFKHVELYAQTIPSAHVRRLNGRDHQLNYDLSVVANDIRQLG